MVSAEAGRGAARHYCAVGVQNDRAAIVPSPVRTPPELTERSAPAPTEPSTSSAPPLTATAPVKVFAAPRINRPPPVLVKPPAPESGPH